MSRRHAVDNEPSGPFAPKKVSGRDSTEDSANSVLGAYVLPAQIPDSSVILPRYTQDPPEGNSAKPAVNPRPTRQPPNAREWLQEMAKH